MRLVTIIFLGLLMGCKISPKDEDLLKEMVVQTKRDENTAFSLYNSFTLSLDTLGYLSNASRDTILTSPRYSHPSVVTAEIQKKMREAGYTYLNKNQNPDLGFAATIVENYNVFQQVNYPSFYTGYYGYGFGGYYGVPYVSTYVSASTTLVINLIDLKNRDSQNRYKVIWTAYVGDLVQSPDRLGNVAKAINQAFDQSPYLNKP
jgi:hypothetical protein